MHIDILPSARSVTLITALFATVASTAACVDDPGVDEGSITTENQELGQSSIFLNPLLRQRGPLGRAIYRQLAERWTQWAIGIPAATNPIADETGEFCALGQSGPVWFLAGSFGVPVTRECDVPFGKLLYFPLKNRFVAVPSQVITPTENEAHWTQVATNFIDAGRAATCDLTLRIDGIEILDDTAERDEELYTARLHPFPVVVPPDSIFGNAFPPGVRPLGYIGGHFALFAPLLPGDHTLEFGGENCDANGNTTFATSATYHLHVH